jgi:phage-related minor tail protein
MDVFVSNYFSVCRQRHALLQRQLESEKKSLNQLAFAQQEMEAQLTHSQQSNATLEYFISRGYFVYSHLH